MLAQSESQSPRRGADIMEDENRVIEDVDIRVEDTVEIHIEFNQGGEEEHDV